MNQIDKSNILNPYQPEDIYQTIIEYLDPHSLCKATTICHIWNNSIELHWKIHYEQFKLQIEKLCGNTMFDHTLNRFFDSEIAKKNNTFKSKCQHIKKTFTHNQDCIANIDTLINDIAAKSNIKLDTVMTSDFLKDRELPAITVRDVRNEYERIRNGEERDIDMNPIQFTRKEAFEVVIKRINYFIACFPKFRDGGLFPFHHDLLTRSLTNIDSENGHSYYREDYLSFFDDILKKLGEQNLIRTEIVRGELYIQLIRKKDKKDEQKSNLS